MGNWYIYHITRVMVCSLKHLPSVAGPRVACYSTVKSVNLTCEAYRVDLCTLVEGKGNVDAYELLMAAMILSKIMIV